MGSFQELIDRDADPRVKNWFMMSTPLPSIILSIIYVIMVKIVCPEIMRTRKPLKLTKTLIIYNAFQVYFSAYMFYKTTVYGLLRFNSLFCEPIDLKNTEILYFGWWYHISKLTEFIDTFFFILRKKFNQVSTLHVFHHAVMPTFTWIGLKYAPGGPGTIFACINCFVHMIMYGYYMFAAMGPKIQKYLWWKKYLTILQLVQFIVILTHSIIILFSDCKINKLFLYSNLAIVFSVLLLFSSFYLQTYTKKPEKKRYNNDNVFKNLKGM